MKRSSSRPRASKPSKVAKATSTLKAERVARALKAKALRAATQESRRAALEANAPVPASSQSRAGSRAQSAPAVPAPRRSSRIITFYSYKGGTGRSMALANVGWILASAGKRVLLIDWDFEAPGLHRYLHPFLDDPELRTTRGLIDYFVDVNEAARAAAKEGGEPWWKVWTTLGRYTVSLNWEFPRNGCLDFVPAGQQSNGYAINVASCNWQDFYNKLGGGVLLEALKQQLRSDYDYVLIDSRTGISDTAGICTVQMPDELAVFFTLNGQSIKGAAAVAESAWSQRLKADGSPGLRVWPIPTRIELAEKERLDAARALAHTTFHRFVQLTRQERRKYWEDIEVLYHPFYAYEEVLAAFAESAAGTSSMQRPMGSLARYLSGGEVLEFPRLDEHRRLSVLPKFLVATKPAATAPRQGSRIFVSAAPADRESLDDVKRLMQKLRELGLDLWSAETDIMPGDPVEEVLSNALDQASVVLMVVPKTDLRSHQLHVLNESVNKGKRIVPIYVSDRSGTITHTKLPAELAKRWPFTIKQRTWDDDVVKLSAVLEQIAGANPTPAPPTTDPEDPQKGKWGGESKRNGRELAASVKAGDDDDWFEVELTVRTVPPAPQMEGIVRFHMHPTFPTPVMAVRVVKGVARMRVWAWGAFTVGVEADGGKTRLELDLAADPSLPKTFRSR
jgi:hypothetical protein